MVTLAVTCGAMAVIVSTKDQQVTGTCPVCGTRAGIVNYRAPQGRRMWEEGYLGRHHRPGTRPDSKCRGSFGHWVERG